MLQYNTYLRNVNKVMLFKRVIDRQTVKRVRCGLAKHAARQSVWMSTSASTMLLHACRPKRLKRRQRSSLCTFMSQIRPTRRCARMYPADVA